MLLGHSATTRGQLDRRTYMNHRIDSREFRSENKETSIDLLWPEAEERTVFDCVIPKQGGGARFQRH